MSELNQEPQPESTPVYTSEWAQGLMTEHRVDVRPIFESVDRVKGEISKVVIGQENTIDMLMAAMITGGHVLLEGLPGIAKTLTAKLLAKTVDAEFSRIQFTPDLMPTDVTGTSVFNVKESNFYFRKGPIFSNIVLIDEINRSPAKTQAALMEVMEEKQITYDGETYTMSRPFFVIATQNPIEQEGTYSLPEAELDRFVFRLKLSYPSLEQELAIIEKFHADFDARTTTQVDKVLQPQHIDNFAKLVEKIYVRPELLKYIAAVINNTRNNGDLFMGASPRASLAIIKTAKALAAIRGREFVTPDDIKTVALPVLNHRLILSHEREMEGFTVEDIIKGILENVEVPR
ncbi:MAG: AAA family ATPase [Flavobacteriales bacterium]|jgi:MoxR-like ATPase